MQNLKLEVFESDKAIKPICFYVYRAVPNNQDFGVQQFLRSVTGKITNRLQVPAFTDDKKIYTLTKLDNLDFDKSFNLVFEKTEILNINDNKKVYAEVAEFYIKENLRQKKVSFNKSEYSKYKVQNAVTTAWIFEIGNALKSDDKQFRLRRRFDFSVKISDENKIQLWSDICCEFETEKNVYNFLDEDRNKVGLEVKNYWGKNGETGVVQSVGPETVVDALPNFEPLKKYMMGKNERRIYECPDNSLVVRVKMKNEKTICYYPQSLKPIITREWLANENPAFSKKTEKYSKLDMATRQRIFKEFLSDIGELENLGKLRFNDSFVDANKIGFSELQVPCPKIVCGNDRKIDYNKLSFVFSNGFFRQPKKPIRFAYFYPQGQIGLMRQFAISLTNFLQKGQLFGDSKYLIPNLASLELKAVVNKEYKLGDTTDYKRLVRSVPDDFDVAIVLVPTEEDETNPYSTFKISWAERKIPSQMISVKTAQMFERQDANSVWHMHNIALGVFAKCGGIPWIVEDVPGNIDCFVGIDVATLDKGIHYPTCATVFDKNGRPINFYKPRKAQKGEKINKEILQEMFDEILLGYEESMGTKIRNLVIHRDGFSNEDAEWYKDYFEKHNINYSVIEIKKFVASKLLREENGIAKNPKCGDALVNEDEAFIVTTDIQRGSPRPLHIKKQVGNLSMEMVLRQILALTCMHFGTTKKIRLPVTTFYADRICKNIDYVPEGKIENRLFFL